VQFELIFCHIPQLKYMNSRVHFYRDTSKSNLFGHYVSVIVFTIRTPVSMKRPALAEGFLPKLTCSPQTVVLYHFIFVTQETPVGQVLFIMNAPQSHTVRRTTFGRTPLEERSARRRHLYLTTHNT
jgi:hypothetical protein